MSESTKHDAIYLRLCDDEDSEWYDTVTWCQNREHESDLKYVRADLVESLRQKLAAAQAEIERKMGAGKFVVEQLADSQKREVMLRDALEFAISIIGHPDDSGTKYLQEALAATADLNGLILCHAEPIGYKHETADGLSCLNTLPPSGQIGWITTPLYRAWEPK